MGLLDALFSNDGGGLLGGLPASWQYQSPEEQRKKSENDFMAALQQDPSMGNNLTPSIPPNTPTPNPFPIYQPPPPPSIFDSRGTAGLGQQPQGGPLLGSFMPPQGQAAPPPAQNIPPAPQPAPPLAPPAQTANVGSYQMPQMGSAADYAQRSPLNANAQAPAPSQEPLPPAFGGSSYLERLNNGGGLIGSMLGDTTQQKNLTAQYHSIRQTLESNGDTPQVAASKAMIAVMNPEAAKTILPELFTNKEKYGVISDNPIEGKKYGFVNELSQTINGKKIGEGGNSEQSGGMLAPGVKLDSSLTGEDYLNQFSPEVKAAVKNYIAGDTMPSGNPRQQGIANVAKTIAQKYGADIGIPVSDALYSEKRKYRTELGTNSPNSAGGQAKAFNQGISHMTSLADTLEKLDNSNGLGVPMVAQGVNALRQGVSNQQSAIADEAKSLGQTVAGEVGKLFSGSAGGGVHERELTRERFDTAKSKPQLAAALRATVETMQGGLHALEQRRDSILGPNSGVDLVDNSTRENIAKIQAVIDRLDGKQNGPLGVGQSMAVGNVTIKRVN